MTQTYSLADIASHKTRSNLWMAIGGKVYDVTRFVDEHPGGEEVLLEQGGVDATESFEDVGHSEDAREQLKEYYIGELSSSTSSSTTANGTEANATKATLSTSTAGHAAAATKKPSVEGTAMLGALFRVALAVAILVVVVYYTVLGKK